jgi:hypothetical protein
MAGYVSDVDHVLLGVFAVLLRHPVGYFLLLLGECMTADNATARHRSAAVAIMLDDFMVVLL